MKTAIKLLLVASVSAELTKPLDFNGFGYGYTPALSCSLCIYSGYQYWQAESGESDLQPLMPPYFNAENEDTLEVYIDGVQQYVRVSDTYGGPPNA